MEQFILHAIGDYITQNHWLATNKTKYNFNGWIACFVHCVFYSLPFFLIASPLAVLIIFLSHFIIDKFRLAQYWTRLVNNEWQSNNFGYPEDAPVFLSLWLVIIIDNILHIVINFLAIKYL